MTPTEHRTIAENLLTAAPGRIPRIDVAPIHARLARAAGTGEHYADAEALLLLLSTTRSGAREHHLLKAAAHAELAD